MVLGNVVNPTINRRRRRYKRAGSLVGYVRQSAIALIAFLASAFLLNQIIPSPAIPANVVFIGPKYDYYQTHKDDYDTLFFGSSRIYSHVVPDVFDTTAESVGQSVNSYNFGIPAMRAIDSAVLLKEVLADPPNNLKWVFFESILDKGYEPIPNARTQRSMYWHTWENTRTAIQYIVKSDESLPSKAVLIYSHLLPFTYQQLNVGRVFNQLLPSELSEGEKAVAAEFTETEGYYALKDRPGYVDPNRQALLENPADYLEQVSNLVWRQSQSKGTPYLSANKRRLLKQITQSIRAVGAEPIFVEPPSLHMAEDFRAAEQIGTIDHLLSYKDPVKFPQLYEVDLRYDAAHLNDEGARLFTSWLANDFATQVAQKASQNTPRSDEL